MGTFLQNITEQVEPELLDPKGQFPRWEADAFLQYCWASFDFLVSEKELIGRSRTDLVQLFEKILVGMKQFMRQLDDALSR